MNKPILDEKSTPDPRDKKRPANAGLFCVRSG